IMTKLMPANVSTGISAFLKACLAMTRDCGRPFSRASLTYSDPRTSSIEERVRRMCEAAKYQPSANAGMIRCSGVPEPEEGSQPRYTEKTRNMTSRTQDERNDK